VDYALTAVDRSGRIAARAILGGLGWAPGTRLAVRERAAVITVRPDPCGTCLVDGRGHLTVPLPVRRRCRLAAGGRLLLMADLAAQLLTGYSLGRLGELLTAAAAEDGDRS
jgi:hypothetical protein